MKNLRSFYLLAAMLVSGVASAQESDDLYFSVKDREQEMVAKRQANAKLNSITMRETMQDDNMRSKFSNPDYQTNTNQNVARMPYFKKDYRRDYSFNSLYAANNATGTNSSRFGAMNNFSMSSFGMSMMLGNSMGMFGNPYSMMGGYGNPYMMSGYGNPYMMNDPYMMNNMAWGNPYMMNGFGMGSMWGNPYMMNGFGMSSMWGNPYMMNGFGMGSMWGNSFGINSMYYNRGCMMNPMVYNNMVSSVGRSLISGTESNSATRPTSGTDYVNYMKSSTGYGSFANSSVGNSNAYSAVEYKGGTANSYFYGTPNTTNGSNYGTRSVDYNNGGSYNRSNPFNSSVGGQNGGGFGGNSSGFGSSGGGAGRSSGGRGGRGN
jgi:hypothetical protein